MSLENLEFPPEDVPIAVMNTQPTQITYDSYRNPVVISKNQLRFIRERDWSPAFWNRTENPMEVLEGKKAISIIRTFAMGDVIICIPFLRFLKRRFPKKQINFLTDPRFHSMFKDDPDFTVKALYQNGEYSCGKDDMSINLDNIFEWDHSLTDPLKDVHRTDIIYWLFKIPQEERTYDYSLYYNRDQVDKVRHRLEEMHGLKPGTYISMNWKGSNNIKTFDLAIRQQYVRRLAEESKIVILDSSSEPDGWFSHPNIRWVGGFNCMEAAIVVAYSRAVIATDSGILWFAHINKTPTICFLGPTTEGARISRHALYPEKCKQIDVRGPVGCPAPCYHVNHWCQGKVPCFHEISSDFLFEETNKLLAKYFS